MSYRQEIVGGYFLLANPVDLQGQCQSQRLTPLPSACVSSQESGVEKRTGLKHYT